MAKATPSKGTLDEQLTTLKQQLGNFLEEVRLISLLEARREAAEAELEPDASSIEQLTQGVREMRDNIAHILVAREAQRFDGMERRVDELERVIQQSELERRLVQESLRGAPRQPARESATMKAPNPSPPIDYTPILRAAIETVRDLGLCVLQSKTPPTQKSQDKES